jgi:hypothetical protein
MKLSFLQKYILLSGYEEKGKFGREKLLKFYEKTKKKPKVEDQVNIITKSLERLIDKGLLIGYGIRTPKKWFIKEIKLSASGRRLAKKLRGEQQALPLK